MDSERTAPSRGAYPLTQHDGTWRLGRRRVRAGDVLHIPHDPGPGLYVVAFPNRYGPSLHVISYEQAHALAKMGWPSSGGIPFVGELPNVAGLCFRFVARLPPRRRPPALRLVR
jgi:hypothetical protein